MTYWGTFHTVAVCGDVRGINGGTSAVDSEGDLASPIAVLLKIINRPQ